MDVLPPMRLRSPQGEEIALIATPPVPRLLIFYRCDCETCMELLPALERLSRAFHGKGLLTLGVSQDDQEETEDVMAEHGLCFPQVLDDGLALSRAAGVQVVPTLLVVDEAGRIVERSEALSSDGVRRVVKSAGALCDASPGDLERALDRLALPDHLPGSPSRTVDANESA